MIRKNFSDLALLRSVYVSMGQFGKPLWQSILHEHLKSDQPPGVWHRRVSSSRKSIEYASLHRALFHHSRPA